MIQNIEKCQQNTLHQTLADPLDLDWKLEIILKEIIIRAKNCSPRTGSVLRPDISGSCGVASVPGEGWTETNW